jgi:hypothetical protein
MLGIEGTCVGLVWSSRFLLGKDRVLSNGGDVRLMIFLVELSKT